MTGRLDDATLQRIAGPIEQATGLPNAAYLDANFLAAEERHLLARTWVVAGFVHMVPEPGDALPVRVAGQPLLLTRDGDGLLHVLHNVCRHRGATVVAAPAHGLATLRCPYHSWTYKLDGRPLARPHFHGPGGHLQGGTEGGLPKVRSELWYGIVFVNLDGKAPPLADLLAPVAARVTAYDFGALRHGGTIHREVAANWKLIHENFFDAYHVASVHPALERFTPTTGFEIATDGAIIHGSTTYGEPIEGRGKGLPVFPGIDAATARTTVYFHVFPSLDINIYPDHVTLFHATALAPDRTALELHLLFIGEAAVDEDHRAPREQTLAYWSQVVDEDIAVLKRLQEGRRSSSFDGGILSPHWDRAALHFARLVADGLA